MKYSRLTFALSFVSAFFVSLILSNSAHAALLGESNIGPDPSVFSDNYKGGYLGVKAGYAKQTSTRLVIYTPYKDTAVYVSSADLCSDTVAVDGMKDGKHSSDLTNGTDITAFEVWNADIGKKMEGTSIGKVRGETYCNDAQSGRRTFPGVGDTFDSNYGDNGIAKTTAILRASGENIKIPGFQSGLDLDGDGQDDGFYELKFNAQDAAAGCTGQCYLNFFRLKVFGIDSNNKLRDNRIFISPGSEKFTKSQFGIAPNKSPSSSGDYTSYYLPFAAPCSKQFNSDNMLIDQEVTIFDDDNYDNNEGNGAQDPRPWVMDSNAFKPFKVRIQRAPATNGGSYNWEEVRIPPAKRLFYTNDSTLLEPPNSLIEYNRYVTDADGDWLLVGIRQKSNARVVLKFDMEKSYAYRLRFKAVYYKNNLQFTLPHNTIFANATCDDSSSGQHVSPRINLMPSAFVEPDASVSAGYFINHTSDTGTAKARYIRTLWLDKEGDEEYGAGDEMAAGVDVTYIPSTPISIAANTEYSAGNLSITAKDGYAAVCARLQIKGFDNTTASPPEVTRCVSIATKPSMQVLGGDARSGGVYQQSMASCLVESNYLYAPIVGANYGIDPDKGSFSEYNVKSTGKIQKFGSSNSPPGLDLTTVSLLFGNTTDGALSWRPTSDDGYFNGDASNWEKTTHCLPNFFAKYQHPTPQQTVGNGSMVGGSISGATSGSYTLNAGRITLGCSGECVVNGRRVIYVRNTDMPGPIKTLAITSNFVYPSASVSISSLPHFVLMVDSGINVQFASGVTRFDGILVTKGGIYTCDYGLDDVKTSTCNDQLIVNGAAVTSRALVPIRTYGDGTIGKPAEQFKLTPEALVSDYQNSIQTQGITTTDQKELPPRL